MIKKILFRLVSPLVIVLAVFIFDLAHTNAAFVASRLMDDGIFDNQSYTASQIDAFLNSFPNSCISTNKGFTAADPTGYSPSTGFTYGNYVSAGRVIADAALAYGLNPKVLVTTIQKEQTYVSGPGTYDCSDPLSSSARIGYSQIVGYGCPDGGTTYDYSNMNPALYAINGSAVNSVTGTCVNSISKVGFSQQIIRAAWLLKFGEQRSEGNTSWNVQATNYPQPGDSWNNSDDPQTCYGGPMTQGYFKRCSSDSTTVYYDGYTTIDGTSTHMDTGATAALYWYTPHFAGNQNFDNIYQSWFGPTTGVDYAWQYVNTTFSGGSSNVMGNTQITITVTAKNTGNQSWSDTNYPVRLATFAPTDHQSALYDSSWVSPTRLATVSPSVVLPGDNGTFTFKANVPNISGTYYERFNLVADGASWMQDPDFSITLNVTKATYSWQMISQSSDTGFALHPGDLAQFTLVAKNIGNTTWINSGNPVRLATSSPTYRISPFCSDNTNWVVGCIRAATLQESSVAPGSNGTFIFTVQAPSKPGFYAEHFNLVMEGVSWFDDPGMEFDVNVGNFYTWQMVSQSSDVGFDLSKGQLAQFTLTVKNTGNMTWSNSTSPVRLATWNPAYRISKFCSDNTNWINFPPYGGCVRAAVLQESSVAPGSTGTFIFTVQAPQTTGFYAERFNLVAEGAAWFVDPWMEFDINVH